jgi:hypothetical protein
MKRELQSQAAYVYLIRSETAFLLESLVRRLPRRGEDTCQYFLGLAVGGTNYSTTKTAAPVDSEGLIL